MTDEPSPTPDSILEVLLKHGIDLNRWTAGRVLHERVDHPAVCAAPAEADEDAGG